MIRYALVCDLDHEFEAWFSGSSAFDDQAERGLVECPQCGSLQVRKALMAPAVATGRRREAAAAERPGAEMASKVRAHIRSHYDYVGENFAREARAIHDGEKPQRLIYGEASLAESRALVEAGVPLVPIPDAFAPVPPKKAN